MKLDKFITNALIDITNGIVEAQKQSQLHIAPGSINGKPMLEPHSVKFDLRVAVSREGGGSIDVFGMGELGAKVSSEDTNSISFEVPVFFNSPTPLNSIKDHAAFSTLSKKG